MFFFSKKKKNDPDRSHDKPKRPGDASIQPANGPSVSSDSNKTPYHGTSQLTCEEGQIVCLNVCLFLSKVAESTRGLFEQVCSLEEAQKLWPIFKEGIPPKSAALTGAINAHAAASLLVYHLRDLGDPLCTVPLRDSILAAVSFSGPSKETALQVLMSQLPDENIRLLKAICCGIEDGGGKSPGGLLLNVAEEHALYYGDGLEARKLALAQLFGPLIMRPEPSEQDPSRFERDVASSVEVVLHILESPWILSTSDEAIGVPEPTSTRPGTLQGKTDKPFREDAAQDDAEYDSDETNYLNVFKEDPLQVAFVEEVKNTPLHVVRAYEAVAAKGEALLKYSSRGKPVALYFFKLTEDRSQLRWAPISDPDDLRYGLLSAARPPLTRRARAQVRPAFKLS